MKCIIFRCSRKDEMYLYLPYQEDESQILKDLSTELLGLTGKLEKVMLLELSKERKLARVETEDVIRSLKEKSYYLQMPPNSILRKDENMLHDPSDSF